MRHPTRLACAPLNHPPNTAAADLAGNAANAGLWLRRWSKKEEELEMLRNEPLKFIEKLGPLYGLR